MRSVFHWQNDAFQWFDFQTHGFTYQGRNASWQCSATLRKAKKKITTRGLFFSAMYRVKLIAETRVYNMPQKHEIYAFFFFFQFFECFRGKYKLTNFLREMKNGLSLRQQQLQVIMYCHEHFISSLADKTNAPPKSEQYLYFSLTLKDTEIFPNLLFWNDSWVTATVFHNLFLIINLYLMTVVLHSKQRMAITP